MPSPRPRRSRRGFSVIEVLIAASLAVGLGLVVSAAIASSSSSSKDAIDRADAAEAVRQVNDVVSRYVRAAVREPVCTLPQTAVSFAECLVPGEAGAILQAASPTGITLLAYPAGSAGQAGVQEPEPPRKVVVRAEQAVDGSVTLLVESFSPSAGFYNASYPTSPTEVLRQAVLLPPGLVGACPGRDAREVFSFLAADGTPVTALAGESDLAKVAVVKFDPQVRVRVEGEECPRVVSSPVFLSLPARGFGR